jgi:hypothetical protein
MGEITQLPRRRVAPKQVKSGVKFDASRLLREHEQVKKLITELATSPLCAQVHRQLPAYTAAAERACDDLIKSMTALGIIH